ncbi:hypothetical protein, partial [Ruminococcus flavefaciens]|uniref:hypothetical protein n=1 Tax=Ruminococcus flavefaciens TaxID=1265 RepID=UPI0026E9D091
RPPTCGTKNFKTDLSSRRLIPVYFRFWVFSDCTFLDNSTSRCLIYAYFRFWVFYDCTFLDNSSIFCG